MTSEFPSQFYDLAILRSVISTDFSAAFLACLHLSFIVIYVVQIRLLVFSYCIVVLIVVLYFRSADTALAPTRFVLYCFAAVVDAFREKR